VYTPRPEQCAGPTQYLYGGTIASLIDCHSVGTAISNYYKQEGREMGTGEEIWCVTGNLSVSYLAPTPIDQDVTLRASIEECGERKTIVTCRFFSGDTQTAEGRVIAVRVPNSWRE
jgi:acyl-CoA thioesterase FadM